MNSEQRPLSPSSINAYLACSARWHYKYVERLPDATGGAAARGRAVDRIVKFWFTRQIAGDPMPRAAELQHAWDAIWDEESDAATWLPGEDPSELKQTGAELAALYLRDVAPDIDAAAVDVEVSGEIAGVPVRGFVDMVDSSGAVVDFKVKRAKPPGVSAAEAVQFATYAELTPNASGAVRMEAIVATKTPQLIHIGYQVSPADRLMVNRLYPHVAGAMASGVYCPNRSGNTCSRKYCAFADRCCQEFGGIVW